MWPFKAKYKNGEKEPGTSTNLAVIDALQAWRGIGDEFTYLGRTCVVTKHYQSFCYNFGMSIIPGISADYADDLGVIHNISFSDSESVALMLRQADRNG